MNRRRFLLHALTALGATLGYNYALEPGITPFSRVRIAVPDLQGHLEGFTIGVRADLHMTRS